MNGVDYELLLVLEDLREHFDLPVIITSGFRCPDHNIAVGGVGGSQHLQAKAADVQVLTVDPVGVHAYLCRRWPNKYGIGLYKVWTHIDVRSQKARW